MIIDKENEFSDGQAVTAIALEIGEEAALDSTNTALFATGAIGKPDWIVVQGGGTAFDPEPGKETRGRGGRNTPRAGGMELPARLDRLRPARTVAAVFALTDRRGVPFGETVRFSSVRRHLV